jgi:hypothetical protein
MPFEPAKPWMTDEEARDVMRALRLLQWSIEAAEVHGHPAPGQNSKLPWQLASGRLERLHKAIRLAPRRALRRIAEAHFDAGLRRFAASHCGAKGVSVRALPWLSRSVSQT